MSRTENMGQSRVCMCVIVKRSAIPLEIKTRSNYKKSAIQQLVECTTYLDSTNLLLNWLLVVLVSKDANVPRVPTFVQLFKLNFDKKNEINENLETFPSIQTSIMVTTNCSMVREQQKDSLCLDAYLESGSMSMLKGYHCSRGV